MLLGFDPSLPFQLGWAELQGSEVNPALWDLGTLIFQLGSQPGFPLQEEEGTRGDPGRGSFPQPPTGFRAKAEARSDLWSPILPPKHPQH